MSPEPFGASGKSAGEKYEQASRPEQGGFFPISSEALVGRVTRPPPLLGCSASAFSFVHFVICAVWFSPRHPEILDKRCQRACKSGGFVV
jgi:hypothetical protein